MGTPKFAVPVLEMLIEKYGVDLVITQPDKKVGRNDPCPCGSGKKYKNCCGNKQ